MISIDPGKPRRLADAFSSYAASGITTVNYGSQRPPYHTRDPGRPHPRPARPGHGNSRSADPRLSRWQLPAVRERVQLAVASNAGCRNVLTAAARAKVSLRIAPGDTGAGARGALARHPRRFAPWGAHVSVTELSASAIPSRPGRAGLWCRSTGIRAAFDTPVAEIGSGGSVPFVAEFAAAMPDAPMLITSVGTDPYSRSSQLPRSCPRTADATAASTAPTPVRSAIDRLLRS